jgi:hypothetical protein
LGTRENVAGGRPFAGAPLRKPPTGAFVPDATARLRFVLRTLTAALRVLPDFVIIGAQKAGSTSLYRYLATQPGIRLSSKKEVHYFDLNYERGEGLYLRHFPLAPGARLRRAASNDVPVVGEATPYYLFHPLAPERMAKTLPHAKLIAVLRNPVDRAYSHYQHQLRKGRETLGFRDALQAEVDRLAGEERRLACEPGYRSENHRHFSYLARGRYAEQLERWYRSFPREQVLVVESEELGHQRRTVLDKVLKFIGAPNSRMDKLEAEGEYNQGSYAAMDDGTRDWLRAYFAPHNERLFALLGARFAW